MHHEQNNITLAVIALSIAVSLCIAFTASATEEATLATDRPVIIDFFFEPGCADCLRVTTDIIPVLRDRYEGFYILNEWDIGLEKNYLKLVSYMERLGVEDNAHVFMVIDGKNMLAGVETITEELFPFLDERMAGGAIEPAPPAESEPKSTTLREILSKRIERFTLVSVLVGGLVDGINPCAISTLVFMISVFSVSRIKGRSILLVGGAFCLASFLTYTIIGFGLLQALYALSSFQMIRRTVDFILIALLVGFAIYSFGDAFRFRRTRRPEDVKLQLPGKIKTLIHRILRTGLGEKAQMTSAFAIGAAVTALESVCTGQVYVPTLAFVVKNRIAVTRGLGYLLLYNLMFILPLIIVLLLTYSGLKFSKLAEWSVRNVFVSKLLLGLFFLILAVVIFLVP